VPTVESVDQPADTNIGTAISSDNSLFILESY